ncbi:response regulator transcription factor [Chloroflexota bacterium]
MSQGRIQVLVADDEETVRQLLQRILKEAGYDVVTAANGQETLDKVATLRPELALLDIKMPGLSGIDVLKQITVNWPETCVVMATAVVDTQTAVDAMKIGAYDYVTKPFGASELLARVRAVLRRVETANAKPAIPSFTRDDLQLNFARRRVTVAGNEVKLTPTEYALLQEFVLNAGKVLTHTHLLTKVWGSAYRDDTQYLHVFVRRLRVKLEPDPTSPSHILTVPGVGYQFADPE